MHAKLGEAVNDGSITLQTYEMQLTRLYGKHLKALRARKLTSPTSGDNNNPLCVAGQFLIQQDNYLWSLGAVDLFDDTESLLWEGDLIVPDGATLWLYWACGAVSAYAISIVGEWEQ